MAAMVRKQIYIEQRQEKALKQRAKDTGVSEAQIIRRALDIALRSGVPGFVPDPAAWQRLKADMEAWAAEGEVPGGRTWTRDDIYAERLDRISGRR